jgi:outer membrane receptor protein involved in Fe transport
MKKPTTTLRRISRSTLTRLPLAAAIHLACFAPAFADADADAQQSPSATQGTDSAAPQKTHELDTITVTAQKRTENVQEVPISIDVLSGDKLSEMNVQNTVQVLKLLPSVSYTTAGPGFGQIYMRGVASGGDGNHSGSLPSVGIYLDEEPITTIQGPLDLHMYDIQRIEALAGPQGTLYGASSQSGTIRYITNKPDPSGFSASISAEVNAIDHGGEGFVTEGYVNLPLTEWMALRAVGWSKQDAGYIDSVHSTLTYPSSGITVDNAPFVRKDFNFADTRGGRMALKIDLNDDWSILPSLAGQGQHTNGIWAFDPRYGDLKVARFAPDNSEDRWTQSALTVQGKIGNFDIVYAFAHLNRDDHVDSDYSDYSYWYDVCCAYGSYLHDNNGNLIDPTQFIHGRDNYTKTSNELRISSPKDQRFRFTAGLFDESQEHKIHQQYIINGLSDEQVVTGDPNTLWLTEQTRQDNDSAIFGEMNFDFTDRFTGTLGGRYFRTKDSLAGFFGFGDWGWSSQGVASCFLPAVPYRDAPCSTVDKTTKENDSLGKASLQYKLDSDKMIYATWSEGFRPGGINRRATLPPYQSDFLTNYEFGWKTEWLDHRLRWNGAVFQENWKDFQFAILGANGLTEIKNAAQARIRGFESNLAWAATYNLTVSGGIALYKSELTADYCGFTQLDGTPISHCPAGTINPITGDTVDGPEAPSGTRLPVTAKVKGNLTSRYNFEAWSNEAYVQGSVFFEGRRTSDLRIATNEILGDLPGYNTVDLSTGFKHGQWSFDFYINNAFDNRGALVRYAECSEEVCADQIYTVPTQPRTIGMRVTRDF